MGLCLLPGVGPASCALTPPGQGGLPGVAEVRPQCSRLSSTEGVSHLLWGDCGAPARSPGPRGQPTLSRVQDVVCDWQQAASDVLVAVGRRFVSQVMEEMLHGLQPGVLPHYFVVRTLANLSVSNGGWRLGL